MNGTLITITAAIFTIILLNIPPIKYIFGNDDCRYSNANGSFTFQEANFNSRDYENAKWKFSEYKKRNSADTVLYRLCDVNLLRVWKYGDYLLSEKYHLRYKSWPEIEKGRGALRHHSVFQDF